MIPYNEEEDKTNYQRFYESLRVCSDMAKEYLHRCIVDGRVDADSLYYFKNLFALQIDPDTNLARILCSNSDSSSNNEATKSSNIRFLNIDQELFNKSSEDFDKSHLDQSLLSFIKIMDTDQKVQLYEALRDMLKDDLEDLGGL